MTQSILNNTFLKRRWSGMPWCRQNSLPQSFWAQQREEQGRRCRITWPVKSEMAASAIWWTAVWQKKVQTRRLLHHCSAHICELQQLWWSIRWAVPQCQISNSGLEACMCVQHCALALCKHPSQVPGTGVVNYITSRRKGILKKAGRISWEVYTFICIFQSNVS